MARKPTSFDTSRRLLHCRNPIAAVVAVFREPSCCPIRPSDLVSFVIVEVVNTTAMPNSHERKAGAGLEGS